jgi:hypothetical protein
VSVSERSVRVELADLSVLRGAKRRLENPNELVVRARWWLGRGDGDGERERVERREPEGEGGRMEAEAEDEGTALAEARRPRILDPRRFREFTIFFTLPGVLGTGAGVDGALVLLVLVFMLLYIMSDAVR